MSAGVETTRVRAFLRVRFGALRRLPAFLGMIWRTGPGLMGTTLGLRLVRAVLPVLTLFVGKMIIDEVVRLSHLPGAPAGLGAWMGSGLLGRLGMLLGTELGLAVLADGLGRAVALLDLMLSERFSNASSLRLMEHAASLDLRDFEDSEIAGPAGPGAAAGEPGGCGLIEPAVRAGARPSDAWWGSRLGIAAYAPWLILLLTA